jgi:ribonuclease HII
MSQLNMDLFDHYSVLAGVDEAGRGPLAGPVVAAAVILDKENPIAGLADSKLLSAAKRTELAEKIKKHAIAWSIANVEHPEIDRINILQASLMAMKIAIEKLAVKPEHVLVDGNMCPRINYSVDAIIGGDRTVPAISAASILAKVTRDEQMHNYDVIYPGYGFARHKGYATREHIRALESLGACEIHRKSFAPVKNMLANMQNGKF